MYQLYAYYIYAYICVLHMHIYMCATYAHMHTCYICTYTYVLRINVLHMHIYIRVTYTHIHMCDCITHTYVLHIHIYTCVTDTGWRRLMKSPTLQIIFHKWAIKYRSLLRKMTYKDKGSYGSSPPCTHLSTWYLHTHTYVLPIHIYILYMYQYIFYEYICRWVYVTCIPYIWNASYVYTHRLYITYTLIDYIFHVHITCVPYTCNVTFMYSPVPRRWDSKWASECQTKSVMVITGIFSNGSFEKRHELWPSRISICISTSILSRIFTGTGCSMHSIFIGKIVFICL